jgi:hypothetical protein
LYEVKALLPKDSQHQERQQLVEEIAKRPADRREPDWVRPMDQFPFAVHLFREETYEKARELADRLGKVAFVQVSFGEVPPVPFGKTLSVGTEVVSNGIRYRILAVVPVEELGPYVPPIPVQKQKLNLGKPKIRGAQSKDE